MINKRSKRPGPTPLMGRQLFRGQIAPLILANSGGVSPDVYAAAYATATEVDRTNVTPAPIPPANVEPCPFTAEEADACENWNDQLPFCKKRRLAKSDPECAAAGNKECPITAMLKEKCADGGSESSEYGRFCTLQKQDGMCIEDFLPVEAAARERKRKQKEELEQRTRDEMKQSKHCISINVKNRNPLTYCPIPPEWRKDIEDLKKAIDANPTLGTYKEWYLP
jgi:hypothetical protein